MKQSVARHKLDLGLQMITRDEMENAKRSGQPSPSTSLGLAVIASDVLRQKDHDELHKVLKEMGEKPDEDGSFMTTVHQAVIGARSAINGVDRS